MNTDSNNHNDKNTTIDNGIMLIITITIIKYINSYNNNNLMAIMIISFIYNYKHGNNSYNNDEFIMNIKMNEKTIT